MLRGGAGPVPCPRAAACGPEGAAAGPPPVVRVKGGPVRPRGAPCAASCARGWDPCVRLLTGAKPSCGEVPVSQQQLGLGVLKKLGGGEITARVVPVVRRAPILHMGRKCG